MKRTLSLVLFAFLLVFGAVSAQAAGKLYISPENTFVQAGSEFTVDVMFDNTESGAAVSHIMAMVKWDSSLLDYVGYIVPEAFQEDVDNDDITTGEGATNSAIKKGYEGIAVVGLDSKKNISAIKGPFSGAIAGLKFKVKDDAEVGTACDLVFSVDAKEAQSMLIRVITDPAVKDKDGNAIDMSYVSSNAKVVKLFNVNSPADAIENWEGGKYTLGGFEYTNEKGDAYANGGKIKSIDSVAVSETAEYPYDSKIYGAFKVSADGKSIEWDGAADYVYIGHDTINFTINFTAVSNDADAYTAAGAYSFDVTPANRAPAISGFEAIAFSEESISFNVSVSDPENDAITMPDSVKLNIVGADYTIKGTFTDISEAKDKGEKSVDVIKYKFESTSGTSYDMVKHPADFTADWTLSFTVKDAKGAVSPAFSKTGNAGKAEEKLLDVDRKQTAPSITGVDNSTPKTSDSITAKFSKGTDADGDEITESLAWTSKSGKTVAGATLPADKTAKGDEWYVTVTTTTKPYGKDAVNASSEKFGPVTILNTAPVIDGKNTLFIRKPAEGAPEAGILSFNITDPDADEFTLALISAAAKGTVTCDSVKDGVATIKYVVKDASTPFFGENADKFTFAINDGTDNSNEITVTVTYRENPPAEITVISAPEDVNEVDDEGEAAKFTLKIKATDDPAVAPYGIKKISWNVPAGWEIDKASETFADVPASQEMEVTVTVATGYDTIAGTDRAASGKFNVFATVTDALDVESDCTIEVTVNDVDRAPLPPTAFNADKENLFTGDTLSIECAGAQDADGDAISYKAELIVDGESKESFEEASGSGAHAFATTFVKNQNVVVKAQAASKRASGGEVLTSDFIEKTFTVGNTAPTIAGREGGVVFDELADPSADAAVEFALNNAKDIAGDELAAYYDIDAAAGADNLTVAVTSEGLDDFAEISYDAASDKITFTRKPYVNTALCEKLPVVKITVTDEDGKSAECTLDVTINSVNEAPTVYVNDVYVVPSDCDGTTVHAVQFPVKFGESPDEENQKLSAVTKVRIEGEAALFVGDPELLPSSDGKMVEIRYTMNNDASAMMGKEATIVFTATDDGGLPFADTSDEVSVKFVIGATPWYPIYQLPCNAHSTHQVTLISASGKKTVLIVEGDSLLPEHYYFQGCKGLAAGEEFEVECREWSSSEGVADVICGEGNLGVIDYDKPGVPSLTVAEDNKTFTINAPLAASYTVVFYKDGKEYKTISKDFVPNEAGLIIPSDTFELELFDAGEYTAVAWGTNPKGKGEEGELNPQPIVIKGAEAELVWPDGAFVPDGKVIYVDAKTKKSTVKFSWPIVSAAESYVLCIENNSEGVYIEQNVDGNSASVSLSVGNDATTYNWYVVAVDKKGNELASSAHDFSLVRQSESVIVTQLFIYEGTEDNKLYFEFAGDSAKVFEKADVQLAHILEGNKVVWYTAVGDKAARTKAGEYAYVEIPGAKISAGDVVYIRTYVGGKAGEYKVYVVKSVARVR